MAESAAKIGDVFTIKVDHDRVATGQVVGAYLDEAYYVAVFAPAYASENIPSLPEVVEQDVSLLALTFGTELVKGGDWTVIGTVEPRSVSLPFFKASVLDFDKGIDGFQIESADGKESRIATEEEVAELPYREIVSPQLLQGAVKAYHGALKWQPHYDMLRYREA